MRLLYFARAMSVIAALALLVPASALADVVYMKNGDRISGKVLRMDDEKLTLETPYAGAIKVSVGDIESLETEGEVDVQLDKQMPFKARIERAPDGRVVVRRADAAPGVPMPLAQVAYINPTAAQSGVGVDWSGRIAAGVTDTTGNSESRDAYGEAELRARARQWRWTTNARGKYAQDSGTTTSASWLAGTRYDWLFAERQYLYGRATVQRDTFSNLNLRWTAGGGYGFKVVQTKRTNLELRGGLDYVWSDTVEPPDQDYLSIGWGIDFDYWITQDRLQFFFNQEGFADPQGDASTIVRSQTGLRAPIIDKLTANLQLNVDYNSDPGPGFETTDRTFILGLGYSF